MLTAIAALLSLLLAVEITQLAVTIWQANR